MPVCHSAAGYRTLTSGRHLHRNHTVTPTGNLDEKSLCLQFEMTTAESPQEVWCILHIYIYIYIIILYYVLWNLLLLDHQ